MSGKSQTLKRHVSLFMILLIIAGMFPPLPVFGTEQQNDPIPLEYDSAQLLATDKDGKFALLKSPSLIMGSKLYEGAGKITKVELVNKENTNDRKTLSFNGNTYTIGTIQASETLTAKGEYRPGKLGFFAWFRSPTGRYWQYDLDGKRYNRDVTTNPGYPSTNFSKGPPAICTDREFVNPTTGQPSGNSTYMNGNCNEAWFQAGGTINQNIIQPMVVDIGNQTLSIPSSNFSINNLFIVPESLKLDPEFDTTFKDGNIIARGRGTGLGDDRPAPVINSNLTYKMYVKAKFNVEADDYKPGEGGDESSVAKWHVYWMMDIGAKVYKYPKYEIHITTEAIPKPDLAIGSITGPEGCIPYGSKQTFSFTYRNQGAATNVATSIKIKVDSNQLKEIPITVSSLGSSKTGTFEYTFGNNTVPISFTVVIDESNLAGEDAATLGNNTAIKSFSASGSCTGGDPQKGNLTGKVTVEKAYIPWRSSNIIRVEVEDQLAACKGKTFDLVLSDTEGNRYNSKANGATFQLSSRSGFMMFVFDAHTGSYPGGMSSGTVTVEAKVNDSCGKISDIGSTTFEIGPKPPNSSPYLTIGWFWNSNLNKPAKLVASGQQVAVRAIEAVDPDGDKVTVTWDFSCGTPWVSGIPSSKGLSSPYEAMDYTSITTSDKGDHKICAMATDGKGGSRTAYAILTVVDPNPIPIITGGTVVKENRPLDPPLSSQNSFSPVDGRWIDHSKDEWTNRRSSYSAPGTEIVSLHVYDNTGLQSLRPATHTITVTPDTPPVIDFSYRSQMVRGYPQTLQNLSKSIDGDNIKEYKVTYGYDAANNGVCTPSTEISTNNLPFQFDPPHVGKYCFKVYAKEDYNKENSQTYMIDVVNNAPTVSFRVEGDNPTPTENDFFDTNTILNQWPLYQVNTNNVETKKYWSVDHTGRLSIGLGQKQPELSFWKNYQYHNTFPNYHYYTGMDIANDNGFGPNSISPWRGFSRIRADVPLLTYNPNRSTKSWSYFIYDGRGNPFHATKKHLFVQESKYSSVKIEDDEYKRTSGDDPDIEVRDLFALNKSKLPNNYQRGHYEYQDIYTRSLQYENGADPYDFVIKGYEGSISSYTGLVNYDEAFVESRFIFKDNFIIRVVETARAYNVCYNEYTSDEYLQNDYPVYDITLYDINTGAQLHRYELIPDDTAGTKFEGFSMRVLEDGFEFSRDAITEPYEYIPDFYSNSNNIYYDCLSTSETDDELYKKYDFFGNLISTTDPLTESVPVIQKTASDYGMATLSVTTKRRYSSGMNILTDATAETYSCVPRLGSVIHTEKDGTTYRYVEYGMCYSTTSTKYILPEYNADFPGSRHIIKIDPHDNMVWAAKLRGDFPEHVGVAETGWQSFTFRTEFHVLDPFGKQLLVMSSDRLYNSNAYLTQTFFYDTVNLSDGAVGSSGEWMKKDLEALVPRVSSITGGFANSGRCTITAEGSCIWQDGYEGGLWEDVRGSYSYGEARVLRYSEFWGDAFRMNMYEYHDYYPPGHHENSNLTVWLQSGDLTTGPEAYKGFFLGQFVSPKAFDDVMISTSLTVNAKDIDAGKYAGLSFRMTDPMNRYAVETDGDTVYLSRYVGGTRAVLAETSWSLRAGDVNPIKVQAVGSQIDVWMNGTPLFSIQDSTFSSGKAGPFTDRSYVSFGAVEVSSVPVSQWMNGFAILGESTGAADVRFTDITYTDPEGDPMAGDFQWSYVHTARYLNNQGTAPPSGENASMPDKFYHVGDFELRLRAYDDPQLHYPYPSSVFGEYRMPSNPFMQMLTVHRRPIADFTVTKNADNSLAWQDVSFDPDRCVSGAGGDCEPGYEDNKGIYHRYYYYITPSGARVDAQLLYPQEKGEYIIGLQVEDEYKAKSYPVTATLWIGGGTVPANVRPTAEIIDPNGTGKDNYPVLTTQTPTITWRQHDADEMYFTAYQLIISEVIRPFSDHPQLGPYVVPPRVVEQVTTSDSNSFSLTSPLQRGKMYAAQVMVRDRRGEWSQLSSPKWFYINTPPTVQDVAPTNACTVPNLLRTDTPLVTWQQRDADPNTIFDNYEITFTHTDGTWTGYTGWMAQWTSSTNQSYQLLNPLPVNVPLRTWVNVKDRYEASGWTPASDCFIINRLPASEITSLSKDRDHPTVFSTFNPELRWIWYDPDGTPLQGYTIDIVYDDQELPDFGQTAYSTGLVIGPFIAHEMELIVPVDLPNERRYRARVRGLDAMHEEGDWSADAFFRISKNLPPTVSIIYPPSKDPDHPTMVYTDRPVIEWLHSDPDPDATLRKFEVKVLNHPDGTLHYTSGELPYYAENNSTYQWQVQEPLIRGRGYRVIVTVWDDGNLSGTSPVHYMQYNQLPTAIITQPTGTFQDPTIYPGMPVIRWTQSDFDPGTVFGQYEVQLVEDESGSTVVQSKTGIQETTAEANSWSADPVTVNKKYGARVRVDDSYEWSPWSPIRWFLINNKPQAVITSPKGTQANPQKFVRDLRPAITWNQTDIDPGTTFRGYVVRIYNEANTVVVTSCLGVDYTACSGTQFTTSTAATWSPVSDLAYNTKYYARVVVFDGIEWSDWSAPEWFTISPNQPPVSNFSCTPNPAYEGDVIQCTNLSTDPDGDAMTYLWSVSGPGGYSASFTTTNIALPRAVTENRAGTYRITLRTTDDNGEVNAADAVRSVQVLPLSLVAQVKHTEEWDKKRMQWNTMYPHAQRAPLTFWAGEGFVLIGSPTETSSIGGSSTTASSITVTAPGIGQLQLVKQDEATWSGFLGEENANAVLENLPDGLYEFTFRVLYSNGVEKIAAVTIRIAGHWSDYHPIQRLY